MPRGRVLLTRCACARATHVIDGDPGIPHDEAAEVVVLGVTGGTGPSGPTTPLMPVTPKAGVSGRYRTFERP